MCNVQAEQSHGMPSEFHPRIPYWNVNVPHGQWSVECPEYLANVDEYDRAQLGVKDQDYNLMTWSDVQNIISKYDGAPICLQVINHGPETNHLELFKRVPSDLRRYREHMTRLQEEHGSVMNYILKERIGWQDLTPMASPFKDSSKFIPARIINSIACLVFRL